MCVCVCCYREKNGLKLSDFIFNSCFKFLLWPCNVNVIWFGQHCSVIKYHDDKYYGTDQLIWHNINVVLKNDHYHVQLNSYWGF